MPAETRVGVDLEHGGRWTSLQSQSGREWLWHRDEMLAARNAAQPGDLFVDAGGFEECFPTIAGAYDHGDVWSRPWRSDGDRAITTSDGYELERRIEIDHQRIVASYRLTAAPGFRFVWAGHASLALTEEARLNAPAGSRVRLWPNHWQTYPKLDQQEGAWPSPLGTPLDTLREDGSALFFMLLDQPELTIEDGERLTFRLEAPGQPMAIAVWRNLGGWPELTPYRSIAIEPAIGWHFDRDLAAPDEVGTIDSTGVAEWELSIEPTG